MALNCNACEELRENAPDFVVNEMTDTVCTSLKNNTGLNPRNANTNCDDMHDAVDCLVGRMAQDVEAYEVCDWKEYMRKFVTNIYNVLKGTICWLCGIQESLDKAWCWLENLTTKQKTYSIRAYDDNGNPINGFRIADGVVMRTGELDAPIRITALGTTAYITGSLNFNGNMPTSYTNGATVSWKYLEHGCASLTNQYGENWGGNGVCNQTPLIWEIQFKKCQLGFENFFGRVRLGPALGGDFRMNVSLYHKGDLVPADWSASVYESDNVTPKSGTYTFNPDDDDMMLMQVRLQETRIPLGSVTPGGNATIIPCPSAFDC